MLCMNKLMHSDALPGQQSVVQCRHCAWAWRTWRHRLQVASWEQPRHSQACQVLLLLRVWCRQQAADMYIC